MAKGPSNGRHVAFITVVDGEHPVRCRSTALAVSLRAAGFAYSCEEPFLHFVEKIDGKVRRTVTWTFDSKSKVTLGGKTVSFQFFRTAWEDDAWVMRNFDHPIALLRRATEGLQFLLNGVVAKPPHACVRRGDHFAMIPPDCTPERKKFLLDKLNA